MSSRRKKSRRDDGDDYDAPRKTSLVDYSKVSSRPEAPHSRTGGESGTAAAAAAPAPALAPDGPKISSQMDAVMRLMAGREERTIAEKLNDPNRPTWEQYKKDNEDKLNLEGVDQKKMEEYRQELDAEREKRLKRGLNHGAKKKKKRKKHSSSSDDDDDSSSSSSDDRRRQKRKKHKKKKDRKKHKRRRDDSDSDSDASRSSVDDNKKRKKKKHRKKKSKKDDEEDSDGAHYRLSSFFTAGSDDDDDN